VSQSLFQLAPRIAEQMAYPSCKIQKKRITTCPQRFQQLIYKNSSVAARL